MTGKYPQALEELMELLRGLPGVGRRSAERMALSLFAWDGEGRRDEGERFFLGAQERIKEGCV